MRHRLVVREVETRLLPIDEGAFLIDMFTGHLAKRPIHEVCRGMVAHDVPPRRNVDFEKPLLPRLDCAFENLAPMNHAFAEALRVFDLEAAGVGLDPPGVPDLPALLGVEIRLVEHEPDLVAAGKITGADEIAFDPCRDRATGAKSSIFGGVVCF